MLRFQVVQEAHDRFRLKLVTVDEGSFARACETVVPAVRELLLGASVNAERHAEIAPDPSGKFRPFVVLPS